MRAQPNKSVPTSGSYHAITFMAHRSVLVACCVCGCATSSLIICASVILFLPKAGPVLRDFWLPWLSSCPLAMSLELSFVMETGFWSSVALSDFEPGLVISLLWCEQFLVSLLFFFPCVADTASFGSGESCRARFDVLSHVFGAHVCCAHAVL